jgi:hypothetical protein
MINNELQHIIQGTSKNSQEALIQTTASFLRANENASFVAKNVKHYKQEETKRLVGFCIENNLLVLEKFNLELFISEGAEQKVYIKDELTVFKLNDAIYYSSWQDYFTNLSLNNYFFPETAYTLVGFCLFDEVLYALVEQAFVKANQPTNLNKVKEFMISNGFENTRNHDYYNADLGIILEDLHDENVLTQDGILYFIDTVFYIK